MTEPSEPAACLRERSVAARIGCILFRHRSWVPVPLLIVALLWPARMTESTWIAGAALVLGGELLRLAGVAAAGPRTRRRSRGADRLITYGVFAAVRNPLYLGNLIVWLGFTVMAGVIWFLPFALALFALEYSLIVRFEEGMLESLFGDEYLSYKQRVARWIPGMRSGSAGPHDWGLAWRSEISTLLQYAAILIALVVKETVVG